MWQVEKKKQVSAHMKPCKDIIPHRVLVLLQHLHCPQPAATVGWEQLQTRKCRAWHKAGMGVCASVERWASPNHQADHFSQWSEAHPTFRSMVPALSPVTACCELRSPEMVPGLGMTAGFAGESTAVDRVCPPGELLGAASTPGCGPIFPTACIVFTSPSPRVCVCPPLSLTRTFAIGFRAHLHPRLF